MQMWASHRLGFEFYKGHHLRSRFFPRGKERDTSVGQLSHLVHTVLSCVNNLRVGEALVGRPEFLRSEHLTKLVPQMKILARESHTSQGTGLILEALCQGRGLPFIPCSFDCFFSFFNYERMLEFVKCFVFIC